MTSEEIRSVLAAHAKWLRGEGKESKANLSGADLSGANLSGADLSRANLSGANLGGADLRWAHLSRANLSGANLNWADLSGANLNWANLSGANLSGANLRWAYLSRANLSGANLDGTIGDMHRIRSMQIDTWPIAYTADVMQIGCQRHSIDEWRAFDDARVVSMDRRALGWWRKAKPLIFAMIDAYPAEPL